MRGLKVACVAGIALGLGVVVSASAQPPEASNRADLNVGEGLAKALDEKLADARRVNIRASLPSMGLKLTLVGRFSDEAADLRGEALFTDKEGDSPVRVHVRSTLPKVAADVMDLDLPVVEWDLGDHTLMIVPVKDGEAWGRQVLGRAGEVLAEIWFERQVSDREAARLAMLVYAMGYGGSAQARDNGAQLGCVPTFQQCVDAARTACASLIAQVSYSCVEGTAVSCSWTCIHEH